MYDIGQIRHVHLEISTLCNASCPWCPRTFWGYPYNGGYPELNLTLDNAKKIFSLDFLTQLEGIEINGNYGDIVMNPEAPAIVEYFNDSNPNLQITINTNGAARAKDFWQRLAKAKAKVLFALDGLEDTHHLYRQNTNWNTVIKNAQTFIAAGGKATWKMIEFDHNRHQIDQCRELSKKYGFSNFTLVNDGRNCAPVFDKNGKLTHTLGGYSGETNFKILFYQKTTNNVLLEDIVANRVPSDIKCKVKQSRSVYIAANGDVSPCCWLGFYPQTYGKGQYHQAANNQLQSLIYENNALKYDLKHCIQWFNKVEKSWTVPAFEQGRLVICNDVCGKKQ